jgi:hypothetical protein
MLHPPPPSMMKSVRRRPAAVIVIFTTVVVFSILSILGSQHSLAVLSAVNPKVVLQTTIAKVTPEGDQPDYYSSVTIAHDESKDEQVPRKFNTRSSWNPHFYSDANNLTNVIRRGLNVLNGRSGCQIASWVFIGDKKYSENSNDCTSKDVNKTKILTRKTMISKISLMQENDAIYVPLRHVNEFSKWFLPIAEKNLVLITGTFQACAPLNSTLVLNILDSNHVLHWFSRDIEHYLGGHAKHPKVKPFPLGLKPVRSHMKDFLNPIPIFRRLFLEYAEAPPNKTQIVYAPFTRDTNLIRKTVPSGRKLSFERYLRAIAQSKYVLSPPGLFAECHRHYEALGMGAIPVTATNESFFWHLRGGPIVYNTIDWNLTVLEKQLPLMHHAKPNQNMVFEEYWMEHVERVIGMPLRWWDYKQQARAYLVDFAME